MYPKILVGMITNRRHHYCQDSAIYQIYHLTYPNYEWIVIELSKSEENYKYLKKRYGGRHIIRAEKWYDIPTERTAMGREMIRKIGIKGDFDYIFFMDADWLIPKTILERLVSKEKDLVGVLYNYGKKDMSYPSVAKSGFLLMDRKTKCQLDRLDLYTWEEILELMPSFIKCYGAGIGLVKRNVFDRIPWRFSSTNRLGDDVQYWHETNDKGFQWWVDLSFKIPHLNVGWNQKILNEEEEIEVKPDIRSA